MAKFLDKKEQVLDIQLTPYGKHLLGNGRLKPVYYGFYDDNVLYDGEYAGIDSSQNDIIKRIKEETQYLEGFVRFSDASNEVNTSTAGGAEVTATDENGTEHTLRAETPYYEIDLTASLNEPTKTFLKYEIGDAYLDGTAQAAPAWKAVALNGTIENVRQKDTINDIDVPQINMVLKYDLKIKEKDHALEESFYTNIRDYIAQTDGFSDNKVITLENDHAMMYFEEINTVLLTENYDIEVYLVNTGSIPKTHVDGTATDEFVKKMFVNQKGSLQNGYYVPEYSDNRDLGVVWTEPPDERPYFTNTTTYNTDSVKYYFDILTDSEMDSLSACKAIQVFNKDSYYVDLDFDCESLMDDEAIAFDIYGVVTEPEICQ